MFFLQKLTAKQNWSANLAVKLPANLNCLLRWGNRQQATVKGFG